MKRDKNIGFKILYGSVVGAGVAILSIAGYRLIEGRLSVAWLVLSLLTMAAGSLSLRIPGVKGRASVGDALITLSVLIFGPLAGSVTAALEGVAGSLRCRTASRRMEYLLYNAGVMALSAYAAGRVLFALEGWALPGHGQMMAVLVQPWSLMGFAVTYFGMNTLLVAAVSALEKSANVYRAWREGFCWTAVNYLAATFLAGMVVQFTNPLTVSALATLVTGCAGVYLSAQAHIRLVQEVERLKEKAATVTVPGQVSDSAAA